MTEAEELLKKHLAKFNSTGCVINKGVFCKAAINAINEALFIRSVVNPLKIKEKITFDYWLEINKIKRIGKTNLYKKGKDRFYLDDLIKKHKESITF